MLRWFLVLKTPGIVVRVAGSDLLGSGAWLAKCVLSPLKMETGFSYLLVFEKYRNEILRARLLMVGGKLQREVTHVIVRHCYDMSPLLREMGQTDQDPLVQTLSRADEKDEYASQAVNNKTQIRKHGVQTEIFQVGGISGRYS